MGQRQKERQSSAAIHFEWQTEKAYDKSRYQIIVDS